MNLKHSITIGLALIGTLVSAQAWDFTYSYQTVYDSNAANYLVGSSNSRTYSEWTTPPVTYWGATENDQASLLTYHFTFSAPTTEIYLNANLFAANYPNRGDYGYSSMWGSTDGVNWTLLMDDPAPASPFGNGVGSWDFYNQDVPGSLLGSTSFYLQVRLFEHGGLTHPINPWEGWSDAQFSRYNPIDDPGYKNFELDANLVPEPALSGMALVGTAAMLRLRRRRAAA